jgi:hypothetical protein
MKTIKSILVVLLLVCVTSLTAANGPADEKKVIKQASDEIAKMLKSPSFEVTEKLTAQVSLFVNSENELVVLSVDTHNEELENYVKARLNYQKLSYGLEQGKEYKLPLTITSES